MPASVRFYFDFISPYAYLAWTQIHAIAERHGAVVEPAPVLFAGLLGHHGTRGPAEVPAKRRYLMFDVTRKARSLGVPIVPPVHHPFNPLLALRVATLVPDRALIDRLYAIVWREGRENIEDPAVVGRALAATGHDPERTLVEAATPANKERLKARTDRAIADGAFGVPWAIVDDEPFWGVDALPELERYLAEPRPSVDSPTLARWEALTPSAVRRA